MRYSVPCICWGSWAVSSSDKGEGCFFKIFLSFIIILFYLFVWGGAFMPLCTHGGQRATLGTSSFLLP